MKIKGKVVKQVNNLQIRYSDLYKYAVWTPDGKTCLEDRFDSIDKAVEYCKNTKDFVTKPAAHKKKMPVRAGKNCSLYESDLEKVQKFMDGIDWNPFHEHLKQFGFDTEIETSLYTDCGQYRLHVRGKENLANKTGIMAPCFNWVRLMDFGSFLYQSVDYNKDLYDQAMANHEYDKTWSDFDAKFGPITLEVHMHLRFEEKHGGQNSLSLFYAWYTEESGWDFQ